MQITRLDQVHAPFASEVKVYSSENQRRQGQTEIIIKKGNEIIVLKCPAQKLFQNKSLHFVK